MRFLFVDRILQLIPGQLVRGVKQVTHEDSCLCPDDKGRLCFVPSLVGETLGQLAAWNVMLSNDFSLRPVAGIVSSARLHRRVYPGETLLLESVIDSLDDSAVQYHSNAYVGNALAFSIEGALGPLLPMTDFIDAEVVRRQFTEIHRPGDWPEMQVDEGLLLNQSMPKAAPAFDFTFDRILTLEPGVGLTAEKRVTRAAPYFPDHFPNKPVLPMTVLLECKLNLAQAFVAHSGFDINYQVSEFRKIKMNEFVQPGDRIVTQVSVKKRDDQELILSYRSAVDGKRVCVVEVVMTAKGD